MLHEPSALPCHKVIVVWAFCECCHQGGLRKFYGKWARLFYEMCTPAIHFGEQINRQFCAVLKSGADLNHMLPYRCAHWPSHLRKRRYVELQCYDVLFDVLGEISDYDYQERIGRWILLQRMFKFLLHNGLSFFHTIYPPTSESLFMLLFVLEWYELLLPLLPLTRAIALQLFALGYGRRELHTGSFPARDANLFDTRNLLSEPDVEHNMVAQRELRSLIDHFDAGPLTLQQLSRIAIRRAVGGAHFARQVRRIRSHIPPPLFDYVSDACEHLLSDDEASRLDASLHEHFV